MSVKAPARGLAERRQPMDTRPLRKRWVATIGGSEAYGSEAYGSEAYGSEAYGGGEAGGGEAGGGEAGGGEAGGERRAARIVPLSIDLEQSLFRTPPPLPTNTESGPHHVFRPHSKAK